MFLVLPTDIRAAKEPLRVGVFQNKPIVFYENGPKGLFVEVMDYVARKEGLDIAYVKCELKQCLAMLKSNELDLMTSLGETPQRLEHFEFSREPIWTFWGTVYSSGRLINDVFDLKHKRVGVRRNNKTSLAIKKLVTQLGIPVEFVEYDNYEAAFSALKEFAVDAVAANNSYAFSEFKKNPGFHKTAIVFNPFSAYFAIAKKGGDPELLNTIDTHVRVLKASPTSLYYEFPKKWFSFPDASWTPRRFMLAMGGALLGVVLLMALWRFRSVIRFNRQLKRIISKQERTEKDLKRSEERFRRMFENSHSVMMITDPASGRILDANPAAAGFYGWATDELRVMTLEDINSLEWHEVRDEMASAHRESRNSLMFKHLLKNGQTRDVEVYSGPIEIDGQSMLYSIIHDVTDRSLMERQLRENESRLQLLFEKAADALYLCRPDGRLVQVNEQACRVTGYTEDDLLNMNLADIDAGQGTPEGLAAFFNAMTTSRRPRFESECIRKDGSTFPVEITCSLLNISDGPFIMGLARDITARKAAEAAIRESEKKYRAMLESMDDAIYICSRDFRIKYMNPAMIKLAGRDATGDICFRAIHNQEHKCDWCSHERVMNGEFIKTEFSDPKTEKVFNVSHSPVKHGDGTVSMLTVLRDITEVRRLESRMQQVQKLESIGSLASGIAHDFNNLLFPIVGQAELLLEDLPRAGREYERVQEIYTAGKRGRDLVKQILAFSRQGEQQIMAVEFQGLLREVLRLSRSSIPANIRIHSDIRDGCNRVMADPTQLHQIAMNLITNAYQAIDKTDGRITVALKEVLLDRRKNPDILLESGLYLKMTVSDNGSGIPPGVMGKIFDPYFTTKKKGEGTGLGLSLVFGIVKELKGDIHVQSDPGQGTCFTVFLPVVEPRAGGGDPEFAEEKDNTGSERILLVDDEPAIARLEAQLLERMGYDVTFRTDSREALVDFQKNPGAYDMVITDMSMPRMTGDRLSRAVLALRPDIPVIVCTGFSELMNPETAEQIGIKGFLMKPVVRSELAGLVRRILDESAGSKA